MRLRAHMHRLLAPLSLLPLLFFNPSCSTSKSDVLPRVHSMEDESTHSPSPPSTTSPTASREIAAAASAFLDSLSSSPDLRARAFVPDLSDPRRTDWHFVPRTSPTGVSFADLSDSQKIAARNLLRSALSSQGLAKVEQIMQLESVLRDLENGAGPTRDPLAYSITIFGTPGGPPSTTEEVDSGQTSPPSATQVADSNWAWKLEGHHISLNFTLTDAASEADEPDHHHHPHHPHFSTTPAFLGSNPAQILTGPRAGSRILAREEDLARQLLLSLSPAQRSQALLSDTAPAEIEAVPGRNLDDALSSHDLDTLGLPVSEMNGDQRHLVGQLLFEFLGNLRPDLAESQFERLTGHDGGAGRFESIRFAWMGGVQPGEGHYYRLSGPTFIIEYDNTQNHANHVHTLWRDRSNDFGQEDLLKQHYERFHLHEQAERAIKLR